ncbi:MAG: Na+:solute symporter [Candidatus Marinimicrobia bacterium]|jgi:SSS family transporter|nr:Na+:solute symporter [Candidatus Neomarinimicrobiota bacterium]MBT3617552.1 Na+:solute symporter [Candidatus Neomarinimicrobiota bacterium]MBT3829229.1 Na+:solute symporter [Candidatus Neomarinimicrobiota bacterium]MBT3996777.1 Na+:solute symporter [Candidatus Neomarinimicrobiota bacterium]MBT4280353.1 Na+:solute symporter [Candidatus Neomarinimicrobiota bacterium]
MALHTIDWIIICGYILFSLGVGVYFSRRAGKSTEEYFLSGRSLPWWIVGTSMVATTFAADTPLAITEFVRGQGIWQNWFWWNLLLSGLLGALLFSRLWRRAEVLTDNELLEVRYSGKPAAILRAFKAGYFSILYNFIVMGWVINAMASVTAVMLNIDRWTAVWACVIIALIYALLSGFWGVVMTDLVQFVIAMAGSIILAIIAVNAVGGMDLLLEKLQALTSSGVVHENTLKFIPPIPNADISSLTFWESPFSKFLIFITIMWWSHHGTDGGGYIIQRMSSAKNEKHALAATLWFNIAHYALRVWPWIAVALVSMVVFPIIPESYSELGTKAGYPLIMNEFLGAGLKGLLVVSFLAAFMSTIDTHLNWGASYLVHDIYKRFIKKDANQQHYVLVSRIITVILMICSAFVAINMQSISKAWEFIFSMGAGIGLVLILRWFWWRINAWTEISALLTSIIITIVLEIIAWNQTISAGLEYTLFDKSPILFGVTIQVHHKLMIIVPVAVIVWIIVTFITKPESEKTLTTFYQKVQPGGWWGSYAKGATLQPVTQGFFFNWIAGIGLIYGLNFAIGNWMFGNTGYAISLFFISGIGFWWLWNNLLGKIDS